MNEMYLSKQTHIIIINTIGPRKEIFLLWFQNLRSLSFLGQKKCMLKIDS